MTHSREKRDDCDEIAPASFIRRPRHGKELHVATMSDVARMAGVSSATVSYVINQTKPVKKETSDRVLAAAKTLGWQPNAAAKALRSSRSHTLAVLGPPRERTYAEVQGVLTHDLAEAAGEQGYDLLIKTRTSDLTTLDHFARTGAADAIILTDVLMDDPRVPVLSKAGVPFVLIGRPEDTEDLNWVDLDFEQAGQIAVRTLTEAGKRRLAFLGPARSTYVNRAGFAIRALTGVRTAAEELDVQLFTPPSGEGIPDFRRSVADVFDKHPDTDGLILQCEPVTPLLAQMIAETGRAVGREVDVIAMAPESLAVQSHPALDFIDLVPGELAHEAVRLALDSLEGHPAQAVLVEPRVTALSTDRT